MPKMQITRTSILTGTERTRELNLDQAAWDAWQKGEMLIQDAFPDLTPDDREFLMTGIVAEEWKTLGEDKTDE
jgi:hypothetical protein